MADKKKMSVEDILAACRGEKRTEQVDEDSPKSSADSASTAAEKPSAASEPADSPVTVPRGSTKTTTEMSVAEILAAARGGTGGAAKSEPPKPSTKKAAPVRPASVAPKKTPTKPAAAPSGKKAESTPAPLDTSSILAAARAGSRPGPISKAEAAARGQAVSPVSKAAAKPAVPPMPAKPAYAQPKPASAEVPTRRGFFSILLGSSLALGFTTLSLTSFVWILGFARYLFPNILIEPPSRFRVGFPGDFAPGTVDTKYKAQFGVWIVNADYEGQQQIVALKTVCTHLGCTPNWLEAEQKFKCPCHGSGFYKDGVNFEGPAPRPLERYAIRVADDGQLEIDKSRTFQQELGQWGDPACYVMA